MCNQLHLWLWLLSTAGYQAGTCFDAHWWMKHVDWIWMRVWLVRRFISSYDAQSCFWHLRHYSLTLLHFSCVLSYLLALATLCINPKTKAFSSWISMNFRWIVAMNKRFFSLSVSLSLSLFFTWHFRSFLTLIGVHVFCCVNKPTKQIWICNFRLKPIEHTKKL